MKLLIATLLLALMPASALAVTVDLSRFSKDNSATNPKLAQMAANSIKGNNTAGVANALDLTVAQVKTLLSYVFSDLGGVNSIAGGGTNSSTALNNNRIIISSAGAEVEASAITANKALASNGSGIPVASATTDTELSYVNGVTSAIQTQLNGKLASAGTGFVEVFTGNLIAPGNDTFALDESAAFAYTVNSIIVKTVSGTDTLAVQKNGVSMTGCSAVSVSSVQATGTCTALNSIAIGDRLTFVTSADASAARLTFTVKVTRQ